MRRRKQPAEGKYLVSGPTEPGKQVISVSVGISAAQTAANRHRKEAGAYTYYVRDVLGTTTFATVTKEEDGDIVTRPAIAA